MMRRFNPICWTYVVSLCEDRMLWRACREGFLLRERETLNNDDDDDDECAHCKEAA